MDENEKKLEEMKRTFINEIENTRILSDMISLIKNITPQKVKDAIRNELQKDIDNQANGITHIEADIIFKQNLINEIDAI